MNRRSFQIKPLSLPVLTLLMVVLASCAPASPSPVATVVLPTVAYTQAPTQVSEAMATDSPVSPTDLPAPLVVATSRGPNLEATDPTTVNLASGQLQLVEFFRFT